MYHGHIGGNVHNQQLGLISHHNFKSHIFFLMKQETIQIKIQVFKLF